MVTEDNIVAYRPQFLPSTKVAKFCTYKHTSPTDGTYYGRTFGFEFTLEELNQNRWCSGYGYLYKNETHFSKAIQKYGWDNFKHEVCKTHLFDWECSFVELCGVLKSKSTGHSYNIAIPKVGSNSSFCDHEVQLRSRESDRKNHNGVLAFNTKESQEKSYETQKASGQFEKWRLKGHTKESQKASQQTKATKYGSVTGAMMTPEAQARAQETKRLNGSYDNMAWHSEESRAQNIVSITKSYHPDWTYEQVISQVVSRHPKYSQYLL